MARKGSKLENPSQAEQPKYAFTDITVIDESLTSDVQADAKIEVSATTASSASKFAETNIPNIDEELSIVRWMLHRWTFTVAKVNFIETPRHSPPDFKRMVDLYDEVSCFEWIEEWKTEDDIPHVDPCVMRYRTELFSTYNALKKNANYDAVFMKTEHANRLQSRLSLLFNSVDGAYNREAKIFNKLEAECCHDWDALLLNFYVDDESRRATSPDVFLERKLQLPQNTLNRQLALSNHVEYTQCLNTFLEEWEAYNNDVARGLAGDSQPSGGAGTGEAGASVR
ncbi:hypothetical protein NM688_g2199 [Phlebia brevispora]|uniref:Uncharacterized protein n=1 Tax=Phlebia brevispora TaxID=194682 RepID=A0ACC1T9J5_9APHY|nr:hypothetical protein NM688_g2199 [Phlebia brevispora]